jgi:hypothetical protein
MHVAEGMTHGIRSGWKGVLNALEDGLKGVQSKYNSAKQKLSSTKSSWSQQYTAVRDAFRGSGISERGSSMDEIAFSMTEQASQSKRMLSVLKKLKKMGLKKSLLTDLAESGIEGLDSAESILASGKAGVSQLNRLQSSITATAKAAGKFSANDLYAKAIKEQTADVKHLARDIRELTKAIKYTKKKIGHNATGTSSWSGGATWVGESGPEVVDLPEGTRITPKSQVEVQSSSNNVAQLEISTDGTRVGDLLVEILRASIKKRGGNVQVILAGRPL